MIQFSGFCRFIVRISVLMRHDLFELQELTDEKEIILRQACGLDYPEPNVIFALCRGNWSSPAVSTISNIVFYIHQVLVVIQTTKIKTCS